MRRVQRNSHTGPASLLGAGGAGQAELQRAIAFFEQPRSVALAEEDPAHAGTNRKKDAFTFRAYKGDDVRHALEALFHGKCAYCESRYDISGPVDIEHFRPKGEVAGEDHPGYWWLAAEWTNLLPSCIDCNRRRYQLTPTAFASLTAGLEDSRQSGFAAIRTGKESCFPIAASGVRVAQRPAGGMAESLLAAEHALLLDPCRDEPGQHIRFHIDRTLPLGIVFPAGERDVALPALPPTTERIEEIERAAREAGVSVRGAVSIQVFGLNRLSLVQERTRLLRRLEFLGALVVDLSATADSIEALAVGPDDVDARDQAAARVRAAASRTLAEIRAMSGPREPYSEMVRAWISSFTASL